MDFELTEEQAGLVDSTRSLLTGKATSEATRRLIDSSDGFDGDLWRRGAELGWPALAIPESDGGLGQQSIDLALVAVELGRSLAATPFVPTVVVADAVARSDTAEKSKLLRAMAEGTLVAGWAFAEYGQPWSTAGITTTARRHGGDYVLNGAKVSVQDADSAHLLLVDAVLDGAVARFLVPTDTAGVQIRRQHTIDVARSYCDVMLQEVVVPATAVCSGAGPATDSVARSAQLSTVLICAEMVGIGMRLQDMTVDYVKQRVQFGRPVGSFQAVKHKCADMRIRVQASTAATYFAALAIDSPHHDGSHAASVAKAYVSTAIDEVAGEALQLHGGIGFTWEHDLHLYLRRARADALLHGDAVFHREQLCRALQAANA
ncbi:acyl-CoA dehydrogenase [Mycolicibacter terrae]|uniref:Acyl-CoA dehydrogenase n=1 Tax=Mycolicibacter terrae TaxID=1788 RepID=A0AAD1HW05_9MYCO|nr:acyl-CoA dehydrogenase family protein [Mycolicibacter terrae]ORW98064.1 acyl-CoA dehydrogenase [Mycolicibacter terrae]BBX21690.1 acyl-CoA dehydrogenase [Mycolicibacter terrae]SNV86629.1 acyl-CoA dehydrogenase domain-containing protein [Mycolicibacter terrae]